MNNFKRKILFAICLFSRLTLTELAKHKKYLSTMSIVALIPAIGFTFIYLTDSRKTGIETDGEPIWWNHLRPLHAINYFTFAYMAHNKSKYSYIPLLVDLVVAIVAYYKQYKL